MRRAYGVSRWRAMRLTNPGSAAAPAHRPIRWVAGLITRPITRTKRGTTPASEPAQRLRRRQPRSGSEPRVADLDVHRGGSRAECEIEPGVQAELTRELVTEANSARSDGLSVGRRQ